MEKQIEEINHLTSVIWEANHKRSVLNYHWLATEVYNAGYREASEVALEVISEIEEGIKAAISALQFENNPIHRRVKHETYSSLMRLIKAIEEKHTEDKKDET